MKQLAPNPQKSSPLSRRRTARLLAAAALPALMLGAALPAAADSVSNLSLSASDGTAITVGFPSAQGFTTGTRAGGYTLQSVTLKLKRTSGAPGTGPSGLAVSLRLAATDGSPGISMATLAAPGTLRERDFTEHVFTCSADCALAASTSYLIVAEADRTHGFKWAQNSAGTETNTPSAGGWSIADTAKYRNGEGGAWEDESPSAAKLMTVSYAVPAVSNNVSNLSLTPTENVNDVSAAYPQAQGFTTDSAADTYRLRNVTLKLKYGSRASSALEVRLHADSNGKPGASLATLAGPRDAEVATFTDFVFYCNTGCTLDGGTSYWIVAQAKDSGSSFKWAQNTATTQTNTPSSATWSIGDLAKYRAGNNGDWTDESPAAVQLMKVSYSEAGDLWVENIRDTSATLTFHDWAGGAWSYKLAPAVQGQSCFSPRQTDGVSAYLDNLQANTSYTVSAHRGSGCDDAKRLETEAFSTIAANATYPYLTVASVTRNSASLTLSGHSGDWWYVETASPSVCTKVTSPTRSVTLSSLTSNKSYQYRAYSAAGCVSATVPLTWITDKVQFTTSGTVSATVTAKTSTSATLAVSGISSGKWSFRYIHEPSSTYSQCSTHDHTTSSVDATGLTSGNLYAFVVYRGETCTFNEWITAMAFTLSLSADQVGSKSATLKMAHYDGDWHHKQAGGGQGASATGIRPKSSNGCSTAVSGSTASLSSLTPSTDYTWKAYKAAGCADADEIASTTFTTLAEGQSPPSQSTSPPGNVGGGGGGSGGGSSRTPEVRPAVAALALVSDPGPDFRYEAGDEIIVEATFSEPVRAMNEHLKLGLSIGGEARTAEYVGGSGTETLRFRYAVGAEDRDLDGIGFPADALKDNFARIHSLGGLAAPLDIGADAMPVTTGHRVGPPPSVPLLPAANDAAGRQGFVRVINHSAEAGEVSITAYDDSGTKFDPVTLSIGANASAHFNASDLEAGNAAKGLTGGTGPGEGDWRLEFEGAPAVEAIGYVRHSDGFLTAVQDVAPSSGGVHRLATFNPASNHRQTSRLRIVNLGSELASVSVTGVDDAGLSPGGAVELSLATGAAEVCDAPELESGSGVDGGLGDGEGKWRLQAKADRPVEAMSLMESPSGHLTNLSSAPSVRHGDALVVPLFLSASDPHGRQGFVRIINRSDEAGRVYIKARDDSGRDHAQLELRIDANAAVHLNSDDLEVGASAKGLKGSTGPASSGDWRLEMTSGLDIEALAYVRHGDGFLTSMHDVAPSADGVHRVGTFNPASNDRQRSLLRIVNLGKASAKVAITGIDGNGASPGTDVEVEVRAGRSLTLTAKQLEEGGIGIKGVLGDGASKWRLLVSSESDILVMSLLESPSGHLTNLSSRPLRAD